MTTTIAAGTGAGTGATASLGSGSNDFGGSFTVTTGTSTAAGILAVISFGNNYSSPPQGFVEPSNAAAAGVQQYVSGASVSQLTISTAATPAASTTYTFYFRVQGAYTGSGVGNTWTTNADGSVDFNGDVHFPAGTNLASGMGVVVFGPGGGQASFPATQQGPPGPAPVINWTATQVPYGTPLQSPNPAVTQTAPGVQNVNLQYWAGQQGPTGTNAILSATDLEGVTMPTTPPANKAVLAFDAGNSKVQFVDPRVGGMYSVLISATTSAAGQGRQLGVIGVPALPYAWWPETGAMIPVSAADNTSQVNIVARVNNAVSGDQCGIHLGTLGAAAYTAVVEPGFGAVLPGNSTAGAMGSYYGAVPAGTAVSIYLRAEQQASTTSGYATGAGYFWFKVNPVP